MNIKTSLLYFLVTIQVILIHFSTHHYETLDWDINAFLVTSLEFGRGNLPFEFQYENKQPLLFLIFFFFSSITQNSVLVIKLINDLVIVFLSASMTKLYTNRALSFWSFVPGFAFIALTSNVWFHPGYSEYLFLVFIVLANFVYQKSTSVFKFLFIGSLLAISTLVNFGAIFFLLVYFLIIYFKKDIKFNNFLYLVFGFLIIHFLTLLIYVFFDALEEYLISFVIIPFSYTSSDLSFLASLKVFITSLIQYDLFVFLLLVLLVSLMLFKSLSIIRDRNFKNYDLEILLNIFASLFFYGVANKGYYHHLIPILYFLPFGLFWLSKKFSKIIVLFLIISSLISINNKFLGQSLQNIENFKNLEENYPAKIAYNYIEEYIDNGDVVFSTNHILILYYANIQNASYIVHPALYSYSEITDVLIKYNKISTNEIADTLNSKPKVIEGTLSKVGDFNESDYFKVNLEDINFNLLNYWEDGEINIYILKDK